MNLYAVWSPTGRWLGEYLPMTLSLLLGACDTELYWVEPSGDGREIEGPPAWWIERARGRAV